MSYVYNILLIIDLPKNCSTLSIFVLSGQKINHFEFHGILLDIERQLQKNI